MKAPERFSSSDGGRPIPALVVEVVAGGSRPPELRLQGEVDIATLPVLDETLAAVVDGYSGDVVVDLADVDFIGVAGLGALCSQARHLRQRGDRLVVSSPSAFTRRVIDILGVSELLSLPTQGAQPR
ncbi:MAG TPA: STAS domain-containing protein [Acidimicrobiales bacterium]|nr:STAS domain-containing protein [Acidimicrobiales bacterium]